MYTIQELKKGGIKFQLEKTTIALLMLLYTIITLLLVKIIYQTVPVSMHHL